jgi:hypothetical protein
MPLRNEQSAPRELGPAWRREYVPAFVVLAGAGVILSVLSPMVWAVLLTDGLLTAALVVAGGGWGAWPAAWLGLGRKDFLRQFCVAVALGLGVLGILTLVFGCMGVLTRPVAWIVVAVGWGLGGARVYAARLQALAPALSQKGSGSVGIATVVLLPLAVPLAIGLFGACLPPGVLWNGEARGYDVLEYHLQVPREYFDAGRIQFLPHSVFASFPQQVEMLYLLLMHMAGGPLAAAIPAQLLHTALGVLTVLAVVAWTPAGWPRRIVAVAAGTVPWLAYLGCLAYVELGVLFFAAVAGGLLVEHVTAGTGPGRCVALAAGLCAGLAGGCKYTAWVLVPAALAVAWLITMRGTLRRRIARLALFSGGVVVALSPWLIRNAAFTGDPIYPFGYAWFGGQGWSAEQDEQWAHGLQLSPEHGALRERAVIMGNEVFASPMFGPALFVLALAGVILARSRPAAMLALWAAAILVGWATLTHMPGRFVVVLIVPLALLVGVAAEAVSHVEARRWPLAVLGGLALAGAMGNAATLAGELRRNDWSWARYGAPLRMLVGATEGFAQQQPLNHFLPGTGKAWLVGEARAFYLPARVHYTVVFNRDPWLEFARTATPAESVAWLRMQNVQVVVFSWPEIDRLKRSYGFPPWVTPAWVESLIPAGLRRVGTTSEPAGRELDVYEVLAR